MTVLSPTARHDQAVDAECHVLAMATLTAQLEEHERALRAHQHDAAGDTSRRRDCHFSLTPPLFIPIETPTEGRGGGEQRNDALTVSPTVAGDIDLSTARQKQADSRERELIRGHHLQVNSATKEMINPV